MAGNFDFSAANRDLISTLMLPIVLVRGNEIAARRLGALLATLGDEALADRPGRSLVLDRLLELILIEALRYRPADIGEGGRGLLAGLADPKIGRALRIMHADTKAAMDSGCTRPRSGHVSICPRLTLRADCRRSADRIPGQLADDACEKRVGIVRSAHDGYC